ncbi:hypothetical protein LWM68_32505 [Niabella sp. W65]|nr:hypothetical protein [Niabella sp. W65]MCH7367071.1 hypothetical protein [Niabella sp. W65]
MQKQLFLLKFYTMPIRMTDDQDGQDNDYNNDRGGGGSGSGFGGGGGLLHFCLYYLAYSEAKKLYFCW